jgi:uncharacterized membrane protein
MHLLFWLSLIPFASAWMGENHFSSLTVTLYGIILLMAAIAYFILAKSLVHVHGKDSVLALALGKDWKGMLSIILYLLGIGLSFVNSWLGFSFYVLVAVIWFIPDKRIEKKLDKQ